MVDYDAYAGAMEVARRAMQVMPSSAWIDLVQAARQMTMDSMSLDDLPAVALALARMHHLQQRLGPAYEPQ